MTDIDAERSEPISNALASVTSRRAMLRGTVAATAAVAAATAFKLPAFAQTTAADTPTQILSIAATAEQLAVTFYTNGINNAAALGISGADLDSLKAAVIEEQIHHDFFVANGGVPITGTFSFPDGASTFTDLGKFIKAQQQLEGAFDSAFIAAAYEFAQLGRADLTRIACMIAMVESEHRAFGRRIGNLDPADNWTFAPQLVPTVGAAPKALSDAGYLSPVAGNTYTYAPIDFNSTTYAAVYANVLYKTPFVATS